MKILVIDDEPFVTRALKRTLFRDDVVTCASGLEGLATFVRERPDAVLCDLYMPGMDGFEVLRRIKRLSPATPCFILTGDTNVIPDSPHVDGVVEKPWNPSLRGRLENGSSSGS